MNHKNSQISSPGSLPLWLWINLVIFLGIWFYMLGARTLVPTDEGRYAEMARETESGGIAFHVIDYRH